MRVMKLVIAIAALMVLVAAFTAECALSDKGEADGGRKRNSRSANAELAAAAERDAALAQALQEEEYKKQAGALNGSSGAAQDHLSRVQQEDESMAKSGPVRNKTSVGNKTSSPAKEPAKAARKVNLRQKAKGGSDSVVRFFQLVTVGQC